MVLYYIVAVGYTILLSHILRLRVVLCYIQIYSRLKHYNITYLSILINPALYDTSPLTMNGAVSVRLSPPKCVFRRMDSGLPQYASPAVADNEAAADFMACVLMTPSTGYVICKYGFGSLLEASTTPFPLEEDSCMNIALGLGAASMFG